MRATLSNLPLVTNHRRLFVDGTPLIDLRTPGEFERGALPGATNLPLLSDSERAEVGICYKAKGQAAAIALGEQLVSGERREARIQAWIDFLAAHPAALLYCWRGGLRSETVQRWLADRGCQVPRISGGFKALRQSCLEVITQFDTPIIVLGGRTGSGKTRLLVQLDAAIDLEGLANHRGSAFGATFTEQPTPIDFENRLAVQLMRKSALPGLTFEDESRTIGRLAIPDALHSKMQAAPLVVLDVPRAERAMLIAEDYITTPLAQGITLEVLRERFLDAADRIQRRLGGARHTAVKKRMTAAFDQRDTGDAEAHLYWISALLEWYYDPMYDYQLKQKVERVVFRGDANAVREFLASEQGG